ncbi:MAG: MBOAT family protein [Burkholderiales bacterium]
MLFNSLGFLFVFLPVTLLGFFIIGARHSEWAAAWLVLASLTFYMWWNAVYVVLLLGSIACNYFLGLRIAESIANKKRWLIVGLTANLAALSYFKYANFFVANARAFIGMDWQIANIVLPLGISFFTFTQIAYLVDTYQGKVKEYNPIHYVLFVTYFPHLIAGPVLHHKEMMPQFALSNTYRINSENIAVGLTIFAIGLFKKVVLADGIAVYASPVFASAADGNALTMFEAWGGALAYTFQLYFDFSGYSDMAIGLSRLFNIKLPLNFDSPYKAVNIIDFWRRWHMTLSRFLRDYLYIALGGNRHGITRRYINLALTMVLGGLWHGAGWTFVIWGALHGFYLVINHGWQALRKRIFGEFSRRSPWGKPAGVAITFIAVVVAWVFFRAHDYHAATAMLASMFGSNGVVLPSIIGKLVGPGMQSYFEMWRITFGDVGPLFKLPSQLLWIVGCLVFVWWLPNTQQLMRNYEPALASQLKSENWGVSKQSLAWAPTGKWAVLMAVMLAWGILGMSRVSEFLYFQF